MDSKLESEVRGFKQISGAHNPDIPNQSLCSMNPSQHVLSSKKEIAQIQSPGNDFTPVNSTEIAPRPRDATDKHATPQRYAWREHM